MRKTRYNITIASLIAKYPKGELTERESVILFNWLAASGSNKVLFDDLINNVDSNLEERKKTLSTAKKEKLWNRIENKTNQRRANLISALQMAASIILICGAFTLIYLKKNPYLLMAKQNLYVAETNIVKCPTLITDDKEIILDKSLNIDQNNVNLRTTGESGLIYKTMNSDNSNIKVSYHTIVVPKGSEFKLMLADGTHVWLNSDSKLKYPTSFKGKYRKVFLEGEAYFDVTKDKEHPFIVKVHDVDVKVLGTSFNVNSYGKDGNVTTTLVEGKVKVENQESNISKIIYPNEQLVFSNDKLSFIVHKVDTRLYTAWKTGRFVFSEDRLESIMSRLSRTYDVEVRFENEKLKDLHFSGDLLKYKKIDNLLEILELTNRVKFLKKNHIILVK